MGLDKIVFLQQVKQQNMALILKCIWQQQSVSRVELVEHTKLTSGTITNLTHELIEAKLIREFESAASGTVGRRRVMLGFDQGHYRIIGLDIGRSTFEIVVTKLSGEVTKSVSQEINPSEGANILDVIVPLLSEIKLEIEQGGHQILGLGVGIPGPMDYKKGTLLAPPNFPGWSGFPIREVLQDRVQLVTLIEDDARTSALAELWYGHGRNVEDLVFVTMGIGIGGGVVWKGEVVWGANGLCGQIGHMTIENNGKLCDCGNRGCWETVGSIPGILSRWSGGSTMEELMAAVQRGEPDAVKCMEDTLEYLETALINVYNLYDPELIILGGRLYPYLSEYFKTIRSRMQSRLYAFAKNRLRLEASTFGPSQSAIGAAALVFRYILNEPLKLPALSGSLD